MSAARRPPPRVIATRGTGSSCSIRYSTIKGTLYMKMIPVLAVGCCFLAGVSPAAANENVNQPVRAVVMPQADSPIKLLGCSALADDYVSSQVSPPQYLYTQVHVEVSFEDQGGTAAKAIRFGFEVDDPFYHPFRTMFGTATGTFSPGAVIQPHRSGLLNILQDDATAWNGNVAGQDIGVVLCYVKEARFADGSVWTANLPEEVKAFRESRGGTPTASPWPAPE